MVICLGVWFAYVLANIYTRDFAYVADGIFGSRNGVFTFHCFTRYLDIQEA